MARGKYSFPHSVKFPPILLRWARRATFVLETPSIPIKRGWHNHGVVHLPDHTLSNLVDKSMEPKRLACRTGSSRSRPGKFKGSRKTLSDESKGRKSNKGNAGWEDPRLKRKGSQLIAGPSHQRDTRQDKSSTDGSKHEMSGQYDKDRETRKTTSGTNRAAERRPVRSKQATAVRPCPYHLRSRVKQPEGILEERKSIGIYSIPQNNIRRRSLSMEALDGDPMARSE
ncbi:uncharacterized protein TNCV_2710731 [Trichonephila clavipes]|nr:uncharacterized protein TNCV_2710731 [Trichonephila clavipes]